MCFSQESAAGFAALGLYLTWYTHNKFHNAALSGGIFFFFLMEALQALQYFWIDQCDNPINQALTVAGFLHICLQPYFTHQLNGAFCRSRTLKVQYDAIKRLCLLGGALLFWRFIQAEYLGWVNVPRSDACPATDWLHANPGELCTYKGKYHLAWAVPMTESTYLTPNTGLHAFLMFAPFFTLHRRMWAQGLFLLLTGPVMAMFITPNLQEQASVWCFVSVAQITCMVLLIRKMSLMDDQVPKGSQVGKGIAAAKAGKQKGA